VVTQEGSYWLSYSQAGNAAAPAGFYTGKGKSDAGNFPSSSLREYNFEGHGAAQGTLTGLYNPTDGYSEANTLHGYINAVSVGSVFDMTAYTDTPFAAAGGNLVMDLHGTYDPNQSYSDAVWGTTLTGLATLTGDVYIPGFTTSIHYNTMQFGMDPNPPNGHGSTLQPDATSANCTDNTGSGCGGFSQALVFPLYNAINFASFSNKQGTFDASTGTPFTPAAGTYTWTGIANVPVAGKNTIALLPITVILSQSALPSVAADTFNTHYESIYEVAPSLSTVAGTYTSGSTGIDVTMNPDATLTITADGAITGGSETATHCAYAGTIATHKKGNVYDVAVSFSDNGGSCPYTSSGTFSGVATYDAAGKLTLTATNGNDKGFMVVATKP
jgi:hypothetical protein